MTTLVSLSIPAIEPAPAARGCVAGRSPSFRVDDDGQGNAVDLEVVDRDRHELQILSRSRPADRDQRARVLEGQSSEYPGVHGAEHQCRQADTQDKGTTAIRLRPGRLSSIRAPNRTSLSVVSMTPSNDESPTPSGQGGCRASPISAGTNTVFNCPPF